MNDEVPESEYWTELAFQYGNARISDDAYPGVLVEISDQERIAVNNDGTRYHFQKRKVDQDGLVLWLGSARSGYRSRTSLIEKNPGLLIYPEVAAIPADPADALASRADLSDGRRAFLMRILANDETREDYAGTILRDCNMRLALHHEGAEYIVQMCSAPDGRAQYGTEWRTLRRSRFLSDLSHWVSERIAPNEDGDLAPDLFRYFETGIHDATENPWLELVGLPHLARPAMPQNGDGSTEG